MRSLLSTVRTERVSIFHMALLRMIDQTDFTGIQRKVLEDLQKHGGIPTLEYLEEGILALKQYYAIAVLDPKNMHAVSDTIDPFWHAHILHTEEYMHFCNQLVGHYIHHAPLDHGKTGEVSKISRLYRYTQTCYGQFFSHINPAFFPADVGSDRLVCKHQLITSGKIYRHGLLPVDPEMQPA